MPINKNTRDVKHENNWTENVKWLANTLEKNNQYLKSLAEKKITMIKKELKIYT